MKVENQFRKDKTPQNLLTLVLKVLKLDSKFINSIYGIKWTLMKSCQNLRLIFFFRRGRPRGDCPWLLQPSRWQEDSPGPEPEVQEGEPQVDQVHGL